MALSLQVELLNALRVVHGLRVDLLVAHNDALPDGLVRLLEVNLEELAVLDAPEAVLDLDLLAELALEEGLLAL